jgi:hypothetical protein
MESARCRRLMFGLGELVRYPNEERKDLERRKKVPARKTACKAQSEYPTTEV